MFKPGDTVQHYKGGPKMTVTSTKTDRQGSWVFTTWTDGDKRFGKYFQEDLKKARKPCQKRAKNAAKPSSRKTTTTP